jgi:hypothetical protein
MDNDPILDAAQKEERELLDELQKDPKYKRLLKVRAVISMLSGSVVEHRIPATLSAAASLHVRDVRQSIARTKAEIISDAAEQYMHDHPGWRSVQEIYDAITLMGIEIGGQNPKSNMTAHMSSSGRFVSSRLKGWKRKDDPTGDEDDDGEPTLYRARATGIPESKASNGAYQNGVPAEAFE